MVLAPIAALGAALRLSRWPRFALGLGTVAFFVVLTGAELSVLRAGVMAGLALLRRQSVLTAAGPIAVREPSSGLDVPDTGDRGPLAAAPLEG